MMKIAIIACLTALAAAEADAWYSPYGYSGNWNMMNNWNGDWMNNWNGDWMNNWNGNMMYWNMPNMQEGYRYNYGKRSADAEPEAAAVAEPEANYYYRPYYNSGNQRFNMYRNQNQGFNWNRFNQNQGYNNWNRYNQNQGYNNWNMYNQNQGYNNMNN